MELRLETLQPCLYLVPGGRYDDILKLCGELCDLSKPIKRTAGDLLGMGTVTAKVNFPLARW